MFDGGNVTPCLRYVECDFLYLFPLGFNPASSAFPSLLRCWRSTEAMEEGPGSDPILLGTTRKD